MEKIIRRVKRFIRHIVSYAITFAVVLVAGSFVLANIETSRGVSLYDVVAQTIRIEMESTDADTAIAKGMAAVKSTFSAVGSIFSAEDSPETSDSSAAATANTGSSAQSRQTATASRSNASANSSAGNSAANTSSQPQEAEQASPGQDVAQESQPAGEEQPAKEEYAREPVEEAEEIEAAKEVAEEPQSAPSSYKEGYAAQVLDLVNQERANAGLAPLSWDAGAAAAARTRASEIVNQFSHARPGGRSGLSALNESGVGYRLAGENIAAGQTSAGEVVNAWMNSSQHRANILKADYTSIGVACIFVPDSDLGYYWVQLFIG